MAKYNLIILFLVMFSGCSLFNQNDFIATENVAQIGTENFIYSVYQTGFDNYRVEFKVIVGVDTTKLFDYRINDAVYSKENSFHFKTSQDVLIISSAHQVSKVNYKTSKGTMIELTK